MMMEDVASSETIGNTSKQILGAKKNAVFIWINEDTKYPKRLAEKLGRGDIEIVSPSWLENQKWRGRNFSEIILDHATVLSSRQEYAFRNALLRVIEKADHD